MQHGSSITPKGFPSVLVKKWGKLMVLSLACAVSCAPAYLTAATVSPATGDPLAGLTANELSYFQAGLSRFQEVDTAPRKLRRITHIKGGTTVLGPRFNLNSCAGCHAFPAPGGTSPSMNPQVAVATAMGAQNVVPSFITLTGPVREVRFKFNPDGTRDGGVHDLYVITGRSDAGSCNIQQPDFVGAAAKNNLSFRIPTPLFGGGLIEAISDSTILANKTADQAAKQALKISGHENRSGNDGTITRFGWKAQNKSLMIFAGEAYNVEEGITNELFQTKRDETPGCLFNGLPEDQMSHDLPLSIDAMSDISGFTQFMRLLAPPVPKLMSPTAQHGSNLFVSVGCAMCHTPSMTTGLSATAALNQKPVNLYSDLLVHHMGSGLADNIIQGTAGGDEFRTAPLWGVSDRLFFLHDGRTNDLMTAILQHADRTPPPPPPKHGKALPPALPSEADAVINNFNQLSPSDQASIIAFLQTL